VKDAHAGKRIKCPHCRAAIAVPRLPAPGEVDDVAQPPPPAEKPSLTLRDILQAFDGNIAPVRRSTAYRVGILVVAAAMLVLPALYPALIVAIAVLLYLHATVSLAAVVATGSVLAVVFLYALPLASGVILLFFMVKPLFARRSRGRKLRTLEIGEEPLLFALVTRVAQAVGAPEPKHIAVDGQVNAAASFGSLFGILFGGDLVLTIGLPLAAGLSTQEFAGVIAHELGHFTQGTGMRLSFVVRAVNGWLARLVYERDDWDEALARGCAADDWSTIVFRMALLCIALTRGVLWLFMTVGHALSCFLLRQMEYDADRSEVRLAGSAAFVRASRKILRLGLATDGAYSLAVSSWFSRGKLPNDLGALIMTLAGGIPAQDFRRLEKALAKTTTGFLDTHPAHGERLARARQEGAAGVFHLAGPATELFTDFPLLSRAVTLDFYRVAIGRRTPRDALMPVAAFLDPDAWVRTSVIHDRIASDL
jgi:Zn-dependent protease with chaperone function